MRIERAGDVATLRMEAGKANAMDDAFLDALAARLDEIEAAPPRALVVTGYEGFFSAGLALPSLIDRDRPAMRALIQRFEAVMRRVFTLPLPVVAAVNGHAIAGGCVLALQADVRIAADVDKIKIGLNEVAVGIGLPPLVIETLRAQVPPATLSMMALEGRLVSPREALTLGLVHEVVAPGELQAGAMARARELAALNPVAFAQVKAAERAPVLAALVGTSPEPWLDTWFSAEGQRTLRAAVKRLKR